ncbi:hypothetical protein HYQ46_007471 [Verticillium longisporum]|nr:hypothetical protein HYQ46_007471 [Verticillium longisporum]
MGLQEVKLKWRLVVQGKGRAEGGWIGWWGRLSVAEVAVLTEYGGEGAYDPTILPPALQADKWRVGFDYLRCTISRFQLPTKVSGMRDLLILLTHPALRKAPGQT